MDNPSFAFFDVDHTLLKGSTGKQLARLSMRRRILPLWWFLRLPFFYFQYRAGFLSPSMFKPLMKRVKGLPAAKIGEMAEEIFRNRIRPKIYHEALHLIELEREKGRTVVLATSAPESVVRPLAEYLGITEIVASRFEVRDGLLSGTFKGEPAFGPGKERMARKYVEERAAELSLCSFYTDSHYDVPLLESVKEPVAVNPDHRLLKLARQRGWEVLRFNKVLGDEV